MHVALISTVYPPENGWGGIGTYAWHMARGWVKRAHRVTVLCGYRNEPSVQEHDGVRVVRRVPTAGLTPLERSEAIASLLEQEISSEGIHAAEFAEYGADGVVFQRRHENFPTVVKLHCPTRLCSMGEAPGWQEPFRKRYLARAPRLVDALEQESVRRARVVLSPSEWLLDKVRELNWVLPGNTAVVRNPFDGWNHPEAADQKDPGTPRVLVLGRLARIKGVDLLPDIFRHVWRELPETQFELVGQDTWRTARMSWMQTLLQRTQPAQRSRLIFHGGVAHPELPLLLARHTTALFASRWENAPYTLTECMWAGLACVVGSGGGAHEVGEHERSVLNTARSVHAMASALVALLRDAGKRARLGHAARERVRNEFASERIAALMEQQYHQAGANPRQPAALHCPTVPVPSAGPKPSALNPLGTYLPQPGRVA
jgi:glycosyltransferase involved in cell wall biosynthesis